MIKARVMWIRRVLVSVAIMLILCATIVYLVDPWMYFRIPTAYTPSIDSLYCSAGLVNNAQFDTIIIGSSMMQNSNPQILRDNQNWNPIKIAMGGMTAADMKFLSDYALQQGSVKRFVVGLDPYSFDKGVDEHRRPIPEYIYDKNRMNDIKYLLNYKVVFEDIPRTLISLMKGVRNFHPDQIGYWADGVVFEREVVLNDFIKWYEAGERDSEVFASTASAGRMKDTFDKTFLKLIDENPDIQFYIIYPPYSILAWEKLDICNDLDAFISFKHHVFRQIHDRKNVKIYDFEDDQQIITNLDNYKDVTHYSPAINDLFLNAISSNEYAINSSEYEKRLTVFSEFVKQYRVPEMDTISKMEER